MSATQSMVEYRSVPGVPGYRVGSDGSVWSCKNARSALTVRWRKLKPQGRERGYIAIGYRGKLQLVSRLILTVFVGPCPPGMECCHFPDPNPWNNNLSNLRWDTHKANHADQEKQDRVYRGEMHKSAKLTDAQARRIIRLFKKAPYRGRLRELAAKFGVNRNTIRRIVVGSHWRHLSSPGVLQGRGFRALRGSSPKRKASSPSDAGKSRVPIG